MYRWMKYIGLELRPKGTLTKDQRVLLAELDAEDEAIGDRIAPWLTPIGVALYVVIVIAIGIALMRGCLVLS